MDGNLEPGYLAGLCEIDGRPGYFVPFEVALQIGRCIGVKENFHAAAAGWSNELLVKVSTS